MARLRDAMDSLLKTCTGEGADAKLDDLVKAGAGMKSPSSKNEDFRRFSKIIKEKAFARHGEGNVKDDNDGNDPN